MHPIKVKMAVYIMAFCHPPSIRLPNVTSAWEKDLRFETDLYTVTLPIEGIENTLIKYVPTAHEKMYAVCKIIINYTRIKKVFIFEKNYINEDFVVFALKCIRRAQFYNTLGVRINLSWFFKNEEQRLNTMDRDFFYSEEPNIQYLRDIDGNPNADPDPTKKLLIKIGDYITWCDEPEQVALFVEYVTKPDSNIGRWNPVAFLVIFLRYAKWGVLFEAFNHFPDRNVINTRFRNCSSLFFPAWRETMETNLKPQIELSVSELPRHWNTHRWMRKSLDALDNYKGSLYWAMNNFADPDAPMDKDTRSTARRNVRNLEYALRNETDLYTGNFWRGSTYSWPETATDTGKRFTSATSDLLIAAVFALGRGTSMAVRIEPEKTDGYIPSTSGLQIIQVTVPTPMVRGNLWEKEFVFPQHVKLRFKEFVLTRVLAKELEEKLGEDPWNDGLLKRHRQFVFLTRVYEFMGLYEPSVKRARIEACISCAQPASHVCSGCSKAFFCKDTQCIDHSQKHLSNCIRS